MNAHSWDVKDHREGLQREDDAPAKRDAEKI